MAPRAIRIVSYNVHRCVGMDRRHDPARIARVIRELRPDVVGLQEVSSRSGGRGAVDQMEYLRAAVGMEAVSGPCLVRQSSHFGNALLARWPIERVRRYDLSVPGREPRAALEATLSVDGVAFRVVVTHLGLSWAERATQASSLSHALRERREIPTIILGDCNRWIPGEASLRPLDRRFGPSRGARSFPSRLPILALERFWVEPPNRIERIAAHRSRLARIASDHLPVKARVVLAEASQI